MTWQCKKHGTKNINDASYQDDCDGCYAADYMNDFSKEELVKWVKK
jgi:hypothetical protein